MKREQSWPDFILSLIKYSQKIIISVSLPSFAHLQLWLDIALHHFNARVLCSYFVLDELLLCIIVLCLELIQIYIMRAVSASIIYFMKSKVHILRDAHKSVSSIVDTEWIITEKKVD